MPPPSLLQRLKERKLVQWALAYLAGAWVVLQALDPVSQAWGISPSVQRGIQVLLIVGFILTLVLAWYHGEKGQQKVSGPELVIVAGVLVFAGVVLSMLPEEEEVVDGIGAMPLATLEDDRPSVAVLPLQDLSPDPDDAYFAGGMQEEILTTLSRISALRVISRSSVMQYAEDRPKTPQIAEELGVSHLVEGSVQVSGGRVRVTVQLIDARRDDHVWSEDYDRELTAENLFEVRSEVGRQIAYRVGVNLTPQEEDQVAQVLTENTEAFLFFLRGREAYTRESQGLPVGSDPESARLFGRALELDPGFAPAHAGLALALTRENVLGGLDRAEQAANRALQLTPNLPEARVALGNVFRERGDPEEARNQFQIAQTESPNNSLPLLALGRLEVRLREDEAALHTYERAKGLDPRNPDVIRALTRTYARLHRFDEAVLAAAELSELLPSPNELHFRIYLHLMRGAEDDARTAISELLATSPRTFYAMFPGQYPVVLRILSREQRISSFEAYSARRNVPCDRLGGACLRRAMHEEAVGSKDLALQYWDSLRVVVDAADPPLSWFERIAVVMTYQGLGEKDAAIREALRLELDVRGWMEGYEVLQPTRALLAEVYTDFGEWDAAIDVLEDLVLPPSQLTVHILAIDPIWDPLRDHPRFQALLERYADDVEH